MNSSLSAWTFGRAVTAYCGTLAHPATRRQYESTWAILFEQLGEHRPVADLDHDEQLVDELAETFTERWSEKTPATWNRNLDAVRGACAHWREQGWLTGHPETRLRRRKRTQNRTLALPRVDLERFLTRPDLAIRERTLYRMLYETAARAAEVLRLDVDELDRVNRRAKVRRKGGAVDTIVWQTKTARLLPRLLGVRTRGPLFVTSRRARVPLAAADLDELGRGRLSYRRADELLEELSADEPGGPWNLHQLRHSALMHAAEDGANTPTLLAYRGCW